MFCFKYIYLRDDFSVTVKYSKHSSAFFFGRFSFYLIITTTQLLLFIILRRINVQHLFRKYSFLHSFSLLSECMYQIQWMSRDGWQCWSCVRTDCGIQRPNPPEMRRPSFCWTVGHTEWESRSAALSGNWKKFNIISYYKKED